MNVHADANAKAKNSFRYNWATPTFARLLGEIGPIYVGSYDSCCISLALIPSLYQYIFQPQSELYWVKKLKIPSSLKSSIAWDPLSEAYSSLSYLKQAEITKWTSGFCRTNVMRSKMKKITTLSCYTCGHPIEDTDHILKCPHPSATLQWNSCLQSLCSSLQTTTHPILLDTIVHGLQAWRFILSTTPTSVHIPSLTATFTYQSSLGWGKFLRGFIHHGWLTIQQNFYYHQLSRQTGCRWAINLISNLWKISRTMWRFRNSVVYGSTDSNNQWEYPLLHKSPHVTTFEFKLNMAIIEAYNTDRTSIPTQHQRHFYLSLHCILNHSVALKVNWIFSLWII
mmetsp:Transcript_18173/g.25671  ORF Transcript_18173/g.25671 Transcript_18173/m.25671 type:complete len:339 (+) Transcript_18173:5144-6160(+)